MNSIQSKPSESLPAFRLIVRCLCVEDRKILLLKHFSQRTKKEFWALPGGVVDNKESIREAAVRELREETFLSGTPRGIVLIQEFPRSSMVEIVIRFTDCEGQAKLGSDPDLPSDMPLRIRELRWVSLDNLPPIQPQDFFHQLSKKPPEIMPHIPLPSMMVFD